jgi:hypothetical protein
MRLPRNGGWKMTVNKINIPPALETDCWHDEIKAQRREYN